MGTRGIQSGGSLEAPNTIALNPVKLVSGQAIADYNKEPESVTKEEPETEPTGGQQLDTDGNTAQGTETDVTGGKEDDRPKTTQSDPSDSAADDAAAEEGEKTDAGIAMIASTAILGATATLACF